MSETIPAELPSAPERSPTTETRSKTTSRASSAAALRSAPTTDLIRTAHVVLQGKGGVGKSLVASLLAQWLADQGRLHSCYDTDPVNGSFQTIPALAAEPVDLLHGNTLNSKGIDRLIEAVIDAERDVVIDNGAASFLPLNRYLVENDVASVLAEHGVGMMVHTVVTGGGNGLDTMKGLEAMVQHFPAPARVMVWVNEYFGPARYRGTDFERTSVFAQHRSSLLGPIYLRHLDPESFGANFADLLDRKLTFAEAAKKENGFQVMERSRLFRIQAPIWAQLSEAL